MIDPNRPQPHFVPTRFIVQLFTLVLTLSLGLAVLSLPPAPVQLVDTIQANMHQSGVTNPVTAVLLNFRAYDTLLEIGVLLVAFVGVGTLRHRHQKSGLSGSDPGLILLALVRLFAASFNLVSRMVVSWRFVNRLCSLPVCWSGDNGYQWTFSGISP
jgi:hypothetical protein